MFQAGSKHAPTSLAIHSRVPVFWPSLRRSGGAEWTWETPWGSVSLSAKVRGLTGQHRRVLDSLFAYALDSHRLATGALVLLVDPYQVDKQSSGNGTAWLRSILNDLKHADVHVAERAGPRWYGSIVSEWRESSATRPMPGGACRGERHLWVVAISAAWMRAYDDGLAVRYRPLLPQLHSLKCGASYALALMVITHRELSMKLTDALTHVMALREGMSDRAKRKVVTEVLAEQDKLLALGIQLQEGTVRYQQHPDVRFSQGTLPSEPISPGVEPISPGVEPISPVAEPISPGS